MAARLPGKGALMELDYPMFVRVAHVFNILFISLMMRSGMEILSSFPKLYLNDHCRPGSEWLRLSRKKTPTDRPWSGLEEEGTFPVLVSLPGIGSGAPLALCGGNGLDADRGDLRCPAALRFPVAALGANQLGDLPAGLAGVGRVHELSPASRWQPVQRAPAVDILRRDLRPGPDSDRDWAGDVACIQRTLPLVPSLPWRQAGRPQRALHRVVPILRLPDCAHCHGDHQWRAKGICQDLPRLRSRQFLVGRVCGSSND